MEGYVDGVMCRWVGTPRNDCGWRGVATLKDDGVGAPNVESS